MKHRTLDFGTDSVSSLFREIFIPTVLGMLSMSAVTTIDGIFVGHGVGSDGIAAVNICIPLLQVFTGVGLMVGMGCSVVTSIRLSQSKQLVARACITQALLAVTLFGLLMTAFIFLFPRPISLFLGSSLDLQPLVLDYLLWFAPSLIFELHMAVAQFALRLDGAPRLGMWCNVVAAASNAVLDWLFIFPLGMGVKGAAIATSIACFLSAAIALAYLFGFARTLRLHRLRLSRRALSFFSRDLLHQSKVGSSAMLGEATMAMLMFMGNHVFMHYLGDDGVGAFGISCYYLPFVFMVGNSIAQSAQPIISYNFGQHSPARMHTALRLSVFTALTCGLVATAAFVAFPRLLVTLFVSPSTPAAAIAIKGLPYYSVSFVFFIVNLSLIGYLQSVERVRAATWFALLRGFIFLIPSFVFLPHILGTQGIWLALAVSESLTSLCLFVYHYRTPLHRSVHFLSR